MTATSLAEQFIAAYNARDWDRLAGLLAPACVYEEIGRPQRHVEGADEVAHVFRGWATAAPELRGKVRGCIAGDGGVALELDLEGSREPPFGDYRSASRPPVVRAAMFFELEQGRIGRLCSYYDSLALYQVLGIMS